MFNVDANPMACLCRLAGVVVMAKSPGWYFGPGPVLDEYLHDSSLPSDTWLIQHIGSRREVRVAKQSGASVNFVRAAHACGAAWCVNCGWVFETYGVRVKYCARCNCDGRQKHRAREVTA